MKPWSLPGLQSVSSWQELRRFTTQALTNFSQILSRNVGFGDNINCQIVDVTIGTSETTVPHNLGKVPIGFIVLKSEATQYPRNGATDWTSDNIYLIANASTDYRIAIIGS